MIPQSHKFLVAAYWHALLILAPGAEIDRVFRRVLGYIHTQEGAEIYCVHRRVGDFMRTSEMQGCTVIAMAVANEIVAAFAITDPIKPEARAVVKALRNTGIKVSHLSP